MFKAPTADDLYYQRDYGAYGSYKGNPDLKPESGHTEQIGLTRDMGRDASLDVRLFRSILHDAIDWHSADRKNWTVSNIAREKKRGLSLSWKQKLSPSEGGEL
ncbi:TonB-dependent receptor domain-containing protein [Selenomonas montiformis]|uniref:TonB-dependent receptor domain-containing protein n=1 Tax=Selenomonas montiformis TaxID=2652285 RepID=UPI003F897C47